MSDRSEVKSAPNYVTANIVMFGVNLTWIFFALWASVGFWGVLVAGALIHAWINWLEARMR